MFKRAVVASLTIFTLLVSRAVADKFQSFDSAASAAAGGWVASGSGHGQTAGFINSNNAGGTPGEAQFDVFRGAELSYLDTNLGMTINGNGGFSMTGKLNYVGNTGVPDLGYLPLIGYSSGPNDYLGLTFRGDTDDLGSGLAWGLRFENSGDGIRINAGGDASRIITPNVPRTFSLVYDPNAGANGTITASVSGAGNPIVQSLSATNRSLLNDASFTRFGMLHHATAADAGHGQMLRFDDLTYTGVQNANRQLNFPAGENPQNLPHIPGTTRYTVFDGTSPTAQWPFNSYSQVSVFKDRIVGVWGSTTNYEGQDFPRSVRVMVGSAPLSDPSNWTFQDIETAWPATNSRANYFSYLTGKYGGVQPDPSSYYFFPRGLTATDSNLYMYALSYANNGDLSSGRVFTTTDGSSWTEISGPTLDAYVSGNKLSNDIRDTFQNHHAIPLNDGRIMTAVWSGPGPVAATTTDQRGLTGWQGSWINQGANTDIGEPAGFQGPDGVIHAIYRGQGTTKAIWDAYSTDNGSTFTTLTAQDNFSDGPSNKEFGRLPGGSIFYIGDPAGSDTPQGDNRQYLTLAVSSDGWNFDKAWTVRWEPGWLDNTRGSATRANMGYDYPAGYYDPGTNKLYLLYATDDRQKIELSVVDVSQLGLDSSVVGDFNHDGVVNAGDYVVWRKGLGKTFSQSDYDVWRSHFGQAIGDGSGAFEDSAVPEPGAGMNFVVGIALLFATARYHVTLFVVIPGGSLAKEVYNRRLSPQLSLLMKARTIHRTHSSTGTIVQSFN